MQGSCSPDECVNGDSNLPVCIEFDDDTLDESFLASLSEPASTAEGEDALADGEDLDLPSHKTEKYGEATQSLQEVKTFFGKPLMFYARSTSSLLDL